MSARQAVRSKVWEKGEVGVKTFPRPFTAAHPLQLRTLYSGALLSATGRAGTPQPGRRGRRGRSAARRRAGAGGGRRWGRGWGAGAPTQGRDGERPGVSAIARGGGGVPKGAAPTGAWGRGRSPVLTVVRRSGSGSGCGGKKAVTERVFVRRRSLRGPP